MQSFVKKIIWCYCKIISFDSVACSRNFILKILDVKYSRSISREFLLYLLLVYRVFFKFKSVTKFLNNVATKLSKRAKWCFILRCLQCTVQTRWTKFKITRNGEWTNPNYDLPNPAHQSGPRQLIVIVIR